MGRSSPTRRLYCEPCKSKGRFDNSHFNVVVDSPTKSGNANCRCLTCGHVYISTSRAGRRQAARLALNMLGEAVDKLLSQTISPPHPR